jgi:GNAT superfamily N-acetyltransferase
MTTYTRPRPIEASDSVDEFSCGEPSLDDYLTRRALANDLAGASRCYVATREGRVVGYYALAVGSVLHADVAGKYRRNMPDPIPVVLLSRLAVDTKEQGNGLGKHLLLDAIYRSFEVARVAGVRAILVHALHEQARDFYLRYDFEPSPTDPLHLLLLIKDAATAFHEG